MAQATSGIEQQQHQPRVEEGNTDDGCKERVKDSLTPTPSSWITAVAITISGDSLAVVLKDRSYHYTTTTIDGHYHQRPS